jgi:hypothetical protein
VNPLRPVSEALRALNLQFVVIGSVASGARGIPRYTEDVDLVVRISPFHADRLAAARGKEWYVEPQQVRDAIRAGRAFNVIHMFSGWKVDLFPAQTEFHESELRRATMTPVILDGEAFECPVSAPEDVLLAKLCWYKEGGQVSDRQWRDIGGVIATNPNLDMEYLRLWAARLRVTDLLEKALTLPPEE